MHRFHLLLVDNHENIVVTFRVTLESIRNSGFYAERSFAAESRGAAARGGAAATH